MALADIHYMLISQINTSDGITPPSFKQSWIKRGAHAGLMLFEIGENLTSGLIGIPVAAVSLIPLFGRVSWLNEMSKQKLYEFRPILGRVFQRSLYILNPQAFWLDRQNGTVIQFSESDGILCASLRRRLILPLNIRNSKNIFVKEGGARLFQAAKLLLLPTRIIDLALGILMIPLAIVTLGKNANITNLVYRSLLLPQAVEDIYGIALSVLNPYRQ